MTCAGSSEQGVNGGNGPVATRLVILQGEQWLEDGVDVAAARVLSECGLALDHAGHPDHDGRMRLPVHGIDVAWALGTAATVVVLAGCSAATPTEVAGAAEARQTWASNGVDTYTVTVTSSCGERLLIGRFAVEVVGGAVASLTGLDEPGRRAAETALSESVPTVADLLDRLASLDAAQVPEATFDVATGVPTQVVFDPLPNAVDDEECYDLTAFEPHS